MKLEYVRNNNFLAIATLALSLNAAADTEYHPPLCEVGGDLIEVWVDNDFSTMGCYYGGDYGWVPNQQPLETDSPGSGQFPSTPPTNLPVESAHPGSSNGINGDGDDSCDGNPVNILTRNKYQREIDFVGPGQLPLAIVRTYNSYQSDQPTFKGAFGQGWTAEFGERIISSSFPAPGESPQVWEVVIENQTGYRFRLTKVDNGPWKSFVGREMSFSYNDDAEKYFWFDGGTVKIFHNSGYLESVHHENGESLHYYYVANSDPAKVQKIRHSFGAELQFTYDGANRVQTITGPLNDAYTYFYDAYGNLDKVTRPGLGQGQTETVDYTYLNEPSVSNKNLLTGISYPDDLGQYASFSYNWSDETATDSSHKDGTLNVEHVQFQLNKSAPNAQVRTYNPHGKLTTYKYQEIAGMERLTHIDGAAHGTCLESDGYYSYDAMGFYDQIIDRGGNITDYDHNDRGLVTSITSGFGTNEARTIVRTWDATWDKVDTITAPLLFADFDYDDRGRTERILLRNLSQYGVPNQEREWTIEYTPYTDSSVLDEITIRGPRNNKTDPNDDADKTVIENDTLGRLQSITRKNLGGTDLVTTYDTYDAYGRVTQITTPSGLVRKFQYHPRGAITKIIDTVGGVDRVVDLEYDSAGNLTLVQQDANTLTKYTYDSAHRLEQVARHENPQLIGAPIRELHWDYASNLLRDDIGLVDIEQIFDPNCNPWDPKNEFEDCFTFQYVTDVIGRTSYYYDSLDRLTKIKNGENNTQEFTYNLNDQLDKLIDGFSRITALNYNAHNEHESTTFRDTGSASISYNDNGDVASVTDPLAQQTVYQRDGFGQAWQVTSPATGSTIYVYDAAGNLTGKTDAEGNHLRYEYDGLNRLIEVHDDVNQVLLQVFEYDTDKAGFLYKVTDESGVHTFLRNEAGEVTSRSSVLPTSTLVAAYDYDSVGRVEKIIYPSGLEVSYVYGLYGRVTSITATGGSLPSGTHNVATGIDYYPWGPVQEWVFGNGEYHSTILDMAYRTERVNADFYFNDWYTYDANDNILSIGSRTYTYDNMDRLEGHSGPDGTWEYGYDLNGNRDWHKENGVQTNYDYNSAKTQFDLSAGTVQDRDYDLNGNTIEIGGRFFDHNELNRFWRYRDGSLTVEYTHDAFGARQSKTEYVGTNPPTTTVFAYNGPNLLHEHDGSTSSDYIYLDGAPIALVRNGALYLIHDDHLGRPQVVSDGAGNEVWNRQNDAFGDAPGLDLLGGLNLGFPGQYYDPESGTHYNYFRTYDPETGRYLQSDPIGLAAGLNSYVYAANNPTGFIDPYGLDLQDNQNRNVGIFGGCMAGAVIFGKTGAVSCTASGPGWAMCEGTAILCGCLAVAVGGGIIGLGADAYETVDEGGDDDSADPDDLSGGSGAGGDPGDDRDPTQDRPLTKHEIKKLKNNDIEPHDLKPDRHGARYDLFKDRQGNIYVKPKDNSGPGDPTGININDLPLGG